MLLTPQPGQTLRLPLDTAFTIDLSAVLPPETTVFGFYLDLLNGDEAFYDTLDYQTSEDGRSITVVPRPTWTGVAAPEGDTNAIAGRMVFYTNGVEPFSISLTGTIDPRDGVVHAQGGAGRDTILFDAQDPGLGTTYLIDTSGGSDRAQILNGAAVVLGRGGNDTLIGWNGNDALYGGGGNDGLYGGAGIDRLMGENGDDALFGGADGDFVSGGFGNDSVVGGAGNDTLDAGAGQDTIRGEDGDDRVLLASYGPGLGNGTSGSLLAYGGNGNDSFQAMDHGDSRSVSIQAIGNDSVDGGFVTLHGGAGNDQIYAGAVQGGDLFGGADDDVLTGYVADGQEGRLGMYGGTGNDGLYGNAGIDAWGGSGVDNISLGDNGRAWGGAGDDTIAISSITVGALIYGGSGNDTLQMGDADDTGHGGDNDDVLYGNRGNDMLYGGLGNDTLYGGQGGDLLSGGEGADTLAATDDGIYTPGDYTGDLAMKNDTLFGGAGNDALTSNRDGHHLYGGSGSDTLTVTLNTILSGGTTILDGGLGNDILRSEGNSQATGGEGADTFVAQLGNGFFHLMVVEDFVRGTDRLSLTYSDGDSSGNTSHFIFQPTGNGPDDFIQNTRTIVWGQEEGGVRVLFDFNGDRISDGGMFVVGATDLLASDFDGVSSGPFFPV